MTSTGTGLQMEEIEQYRRELTGYCYRMLGSGFEAEDAVQETFLRAWKHAEDFEGRSSVKSWLYRIATNVCIDMSRAVQRRARPMDMGPSSPPDERHLGAPVTESLWITPVSDAVVGPGALGADPAAVAEYRDTIRLAFITALATLPPRQRAALILFDVFKMSAAEVAPILETTVTSVNSAVQRARANLAVHPQQKPKELAPEALELVDRYADAFERYDIGEIVSMLHADAVQSMPPFPMWIQGAANIGTWMVQPGPSHCRGSKVLRFEANGLPALAQYRPDPEGGYAPWGVHLLDIEDGAIIAIHTFLAMLDSGRLFSSLGLPNVPE